MIPVAFVTDYYLRGTVPHPLGVGGASLIVVAFLIMVTLNAPRRSADAAKGGGAMAREGLPTPPLDRSLLPARGVPSVD